VQVNWPLFIEIAGLVGAVVLYLDRRLRSIEQQQATMSTKVEMIYDFWKHVMERRGLVHEQRSRGSEEPPVKHV
jgi:hypothetical protein